MSKQYLFRVKIFSKKNSHPLETICFYSGQDQLDIVNSKTYRSNTKENVVWSNIEIPSKETNFEKFSQLPEYLKFRNANPKKDMITNARNILWQQVATREAREDAQLSRMFEVAIPSFFSTNEAADMLKRFSQILVQDGMIADSSLHSRHNSLTISLLDKFKQLNHGIEEDLEKPDTSSVFSYQGYIICPLRAYENGQFTNKDRSWNQTSKLEEWRYKWVEILAEMIDKAKISDEEKISWDEKMNIYSEYSNIKQTLLNQKSIKLSI
jgi:hypothetical protein